MLDKNIENHPFMLMNFEDIKPLTKDMANKILKRVNNTGEIRSDSPIELAPKEFYCTSVFERSLNLINSLERIAFTIDFLKRFPSPKTYEKQGINRFDWLEYHYSYFVITYVSLYEISLILVNSVYRLGIADRFCNNSTIRKNSWVKDTDVDNILKELDNIIQPYRHPRNLHVHRGELPDIKEKADYDFWDIIQLLEFSNQISEPIVERKILQDAYASQTFFLTRNLTKEIENVQDIVSKLLTSLLPIYKKKSTKLQSDY